jgi:hypothetical protein
MINMNYLSFYESSYKLRGEWIIPAIKKKLTSHKKQNNLDAINFLFQALTIYENTKVQEKKKEDN